MNTLIAIVGLGVFCLVAEIFNFRKAIIPVSVIALLALFGLTITDNLPQVAGDYSNMIEETSFSKTFSSLFILLTSLLLVLSNNVYKNTSKISDFISIKIFMLSGAIAMVSFNNMAMFFLGIEVLSIALYVLAGSHRLDIRSNEAGMKYFLMGSFASGILLFGIAMLYGATGTFDVPTLYDASISANTEYWFYIGVILITIGMLFKIAAVPFHFWAPDVYEGAPLIVTAFMSTFAKVVAMAAFFKLITILNSYMAYSYEIVILVISILSMTIGNIMALRQNSVKRILAFSGISHAGFLLMTLLNIGAAANNLLYYSASYALAGVAAFSVLIYVCKNEDDDKIDNFNGLAKRNPLMAVIMSLALLSMAGIPILSGFFAKLFLLNQVISAGFLVLAIVAIVNSMISVYYYFRVILAMYTKDSVKQEVEHGSEFYIVGIVAAVLLIVLGLFPDTILHII